MVISKAFSHDQQNSPCNIAHKKHFFCQIRKFFSVVSTSVGLEENIYQKVSDRYDAFIFALFSAINSLNLYLSSSGQVEKL
jgi:hypothetical protein